MSTNKYFNAEIVFMIQQTTSREGLACSNENVTAEQSLLAETEDDGQLKGWRVTVRNRLQNFVRRVMDATASSVSGSTSHSKSICNYRIAYSADIVNHARVIIPENVNNTPINKAMGLMIKSMIEGALDDMVASQEILAAYLDKLLRCKAKGSCGINDIYKLFEEWGKLVSDSPLADTLCEFYTDESSPLYEISIALSIILSNMEFSNVHQGSWASQYSLFTQKIAESVLPHDALKKFVHDSLVVKVSKFIEPLKALIENLDSNQTSSLSNLNKTGLCVL